jgi:alcohol dehydrogenase
VDALFDLNADVGIPAALADLDIPAENIPEMARIALTVARPVANNPRKPALEEVIALYQQAHSPAL